MILGLEVSNLTKRFGEVVALENVSLTFDSHEIFSIAGLPGAGKSTILRLLAGEETPTNGIVRVVRDRAGSSSIESTAIAFGSFQTPQKIPAISELDRASYVLFDDPFVELEGASRRAAYDEFRLRHSKFEGTFIVATDSSCDAEAVSDRIGVLNEGSLRQCGSPSEILDSPKDKFVAEFFGQPEINMLPGILEKDGQAMLIGNQTISLCGRIDEIFCRDIWVGVRPAKIQLLREGNGWRGRILSTMRHGDSILIKLIVENLPLRVLTDPTQEFTEGELVNVRIRAEDYLVFDDKGIRLEPL